MSRSLFILIIALNFMNQCRVVYHYCTSKGRGQQLRTSHTTKKSSVEDDKDAEFNMQNVIYSILHHGI